MSATDVTEASSPPPALRVERGRPTDEEIGALTIVAAALTGGGDGGGGGDDLARRGFWADRRRTLNPGACLGWTR